MTFHVEHDWFKPDFLKWECCRKCGIVRRADDKNNPCRGVVRVGLRVSPPPHTRESE